MYGFGREPLSVFTKAPAGSLAWSKTVVYGFGQELREDQTGASVSTIYLQSDQVGSPNYATDATGALVNQSKNLPFGERMLDASPSAPKSLRRFTNHEDDPDSNAIYMQAREYLAAYGKFAEVDPAYDQTKDDPESWNLYNYTTNNPVTHTDPDGRMPIALNQAEWNKANNERADAESGGSGIPDDPTFQPDGATTQQQDAQSAAGSEVKKIAGTGDLATKGATPVEKTTVSAKTGQGKTWEYNASKTKNNSDDGKVEGKGVYVDLKAEAKGPEGEVGGTPGQKDGKETHITLGSVQATGDIGAAEGSSKLYTSKYFDLSVSTKALSLSGQATLAPTGAIDVTDKKTSMGTPGFGIGGTATLGKVEFSGTLKLGGVNISITPGINVGAEAGIKAGKSGFGAALGSLLKLGFNVSWGN